jgi:hypothetical protein
MIRRIITTAAAVAVLAATAGAASDCSGGRSGTDKPEPTHSTSVGPSGTGSPSLIPEDRSVQIPVNQADAEYMAAHGATFICGDGGMSYLDVIHACVGHGGISETVRR